MLNYKAVEGSQNEKPLDFEINGKTVYLRKNIKQITKTDEASGDEIMFWQYDEAQLSTEEYQEYRNEEIYGNQTIIMSALADIAEMIG